MTSQTWTKSIPPVASLEEKSEVELDDANKLFSVVSLCLLSTELHCFVDRRTTR